MIKCIECIYCKDTWEGVLLEKYPVKVCIHPRNVQVKQKSRDELEWVVTTNPFLRVGEDPVHGCEYGEEL